MCNGNSEHQGGGGVYTANTGTLEPSLAGASWLVLLTSEDTSANQYINVFNIVSKLLYLHTVDSVSYLCFQIQFLHIASLSNTSNSRDTVVLEKKFRCCIITSLII